MSGNRYLLDTNAIIALLQKDSNLVKLLQNANWVGVSVISQIEFLAFSGLSEADLQLFKSIALSSHQDHLKDSIREYKEALV